MLTREKLMRDQKFKDNEDGALLAFFAICCAAIFLIAALSFDLGRRASTQTELQSFADNVALAAAGELNGFPGAIARAQLAADQLIRDKFTFGNGDRNLGGVEDFTLTFYASLPDNENLWDPALPADSSSDLSARFARVQLDEVDVPWVFANILSIFSTDPLPDEAVGAEATAGYTSLACDIAPVFFCMPQADSRDPDGIWDPKNHKGDLVLLRTGQQGNSFWDSGNFGWLDVRENIPEESLVNPYGDCAGLTGSTLLVCLIAAENGVTTCFENGLLTTLPGQKQGIESAVFNTRFDMFNAKVSQYADNTNFQPAPIVTRGFKDSSDDACLKNSVQDIETAPFPVDDCFGSGGGLCQSYGGQVRFGDGVWTQGRREYVEANYSTDYESAGSFAVDDPLTPLVNEAEIQNGYHVNDPFSPANAGAGDIVLNNNAWRYDYFIAEVITTYWDYWGPSGPMGFPDKQTAFNAYKTNPDMVFETPMSVNDGTSMIAQYEDDLGNLYPRSETGLPRCAVDPNEGGLNEFNVSPNPRRRTVVAAVVDCSTTGPNAPGIKGKDKDVQATYFIEMFLTEPVKGDPTDKTKFDMWLEIVSPALNPGNEVVASGRFQNLVQIYR
jgi:Putative Flp pilus-assembly TadE/G-like